MDKPKHELFGAVAIRLGFITKAQVKKSLERQNDLKQKGFRRLIGLVLLDMDYLDTTQLIKILKELEQRRKVNENGKQ
ncbi:MAG: hypothetical protein WC980_00410 [Candidatus Brocadiia bacterium]